MGGDYHSIPQYDYYFGQLPSFWGRQEINHFSINMRVVEIEFLSCLIFVGDCFAALQ